MDIIMPICLLIYLSYNNFIWDLTMVFFCCRCLFLHKVGFTEFFRITFLTSQNSFSVLCNVQKCNCLRFSGSIHFHLFRSHFLFPCLFGPCQFILIPLSAEPSHCERLFLVCLYLGRNSGGSSLWAYRGQTAHTYDKPLALSILWRENSWFQLLFSSWLSTLPSEPLLAIPKIFFSQAEHMLPYCFFCLPIQTTISCCFVVVGSLSLPGIFWGLCQFSCKCVPWFSFCFLVVVFNFMWRFGETGK